MTVQRALGVGSQLPCAPQREQFEQALHAAPAVPQT